MKNCETVFGTPFCGATKGEKSKRSSVKCRVSPDLLDTFTHTHFFVIAQRNVQLRRLFVIALLAYTFFQIVVYTCMNCVFPEPRILFLTNELTNAFCKPTDWASSVRGKPRSQPG